ncbi:phage major capsid protein [Marinivivus vitaminiproducens]|uniref:phage major capsid protein n=1 Tax=Marinivivus vitaminiproducens TaxID=3035935 RepID=UPI0027A984A9|nr:Mu-like prophage major head subunit gpT family protein [Geminicoccaceae bacterium SCSIO 64248]
MNTPQGGPQYWPGENVSSILSNAQLSQDDPNHRAFCMALKLAYTTLPHAEPPAYVAHLPSTLEDTAKDCLQRVGRFTAGLQNGPAISMAMNTTSDFPLVVQEATNIFLRNSYDEEPSPLQYGLAKRVLTPDFKGVNRVAVGGRSTLEEVNENGEFKYGSFVEEGGTIYKLHTYGNILSVSRQLLFNGGVRALERIGQDQGRVIRRFEADKLAKMLNDNPVIYDGKTLFHADHNNLGEPGALTVENLSNARLAMRRQVDVDGKTPINIRPKILLIDPSNETVAQQLTAALTPGQSEHVNPFSYLQVIVEPRLTEGDWYLIAPFPQAEGLEYSYLGSQPGPEFRSDAPLDYDGFRYRIRLDFGCGWADWRGWYKVPAVEN